MYGRRCASIKMEPMHNCACNWNYCLAFATRSVTLWHIQGTDSDDIIRTNPDSGNTIFSYDYWNQIKKPSFLVSLFAILTLISVNFADFITGLMTATHKTISETQTMISQQCGHSPAVLSVNITKSLVYPENISVETHYFEMLVPESLCYIIYVGDFYRCVGDFPNAMNRSPTSKTCRIKLVAHTRSPTFVTNIDVNHNFRSLLHQYVCSRLYPLAVSLF